MHGHFRKLLSLFDHTIENHGDEIVVKITGDKQDLVKLEKALKSLKDLREVCRDFREAHGDMCEAACC